MEKQYDVTYGGWVNVGEAVGVGAAHYNACVWVVGAIKPLVAAGTRIDIYTGRHNLTAGEYEFDFGGTIRIEADDKDHALQLAQMLVDLIFKPLRIDEKGFERCDWEVYTAREAEDD